MFLSFEANLCLRNNQDGYRSKSVTAMGDLIIGNCPCFIAFPELCIEWCKENNSLSSSVSKTCVNTQSVGKDKVPHREMDLFRDAQEKTAMDSLQFARTHINFLTVNFPRKKKLALATCGRKVYHAYKTRANMHHTVNHSPKLRRPKQTSPQQGIEKT